MKLVDWNVSAWAWLLMVALPVGIYLAGMLVERMGGRNHDYV